MARRRKKPRRQASTRAKRPRPESFDNRPLADLKRLAEAAAQDPKPAAEATEPPEPETSREPEGDPDTDAFARAMAGVKPLDLTPVIDPPEPSLPKRPSPEIEEEAEVLAALQELIGGERALAIHLTDESIEGLAEGIDPNLLRRLKRGEFSVQDHLDLHGTSREEARPIVVRFLTSAMAKGQRCVLIIHGRGHGSKDKIPVLKLALNTWLLRSGIRKSILAFCTARPCDGGGGAIYVLLRKNRRS